MNSYRGTRAEDEPEFVEDGYWMLEIKCLAPGHYRHGTYEGEFIAGYASSITFRDAWLDALHGSPIGWDTLAKIEEWKNQHDNPVDPHAGMLALSWEPKATVYDDGPFDPYAGNLDTLLGY
jgi:hypothetical protein